MCEPALEAVMTQIVDDLLVDIDPETNYYICVRVASSEYYTLDQYNSFNKADNLRFTVLN